MKSSYNTEEFAHFIKCLLSLEKGSKFIFITKEERTELKFTGNKSKLQKEIFEWLAIRRGYDNDN